MHDDPEMLHTETSFITNENGCSLYERFSVLLGKNTRWFDCLVGYFFISVFYRLYPALEAVEHIRILVGLKADAPEELDFLMAANVLKPAHLRSPTYAMHVPAWELI